VTTDIGDHLVQITHRRVFNCYLVIEDDGLTLIDTGPAGALAKIRLEVRRLGRPLRRVFLTHAHRDHLGGLDELATGLGAKLDVIIGQREAALLAGDFSLQHDEPLPEPEPRSYGRPQTQPTRTVEDGACIGSLAVIATPGHTPGHMALLDPRSGTIIAGDALTTLGRVAVAGDLVWRWPFPALSTWNRLLAFQSAKRLLDEQPTSLASGHGPIIHDACTHLAAAIARAATSARPRQADSAVHAS
jgi:glyoxylase-like metal-dependent hydrolase (beta-lactamase superfamily II)